jgi:enoyl-CoA hydratase/carnithine racemase
MGTTQTISTETTGGVACVTFRRPEQLNAISSLMMTEITETFEGLNGDASVGAIVVTGEGRGFMAGADIKEYAGQSDTEFGAFQTRGRRMYAAIEGNRKPVIAAVNGYALGGGFELVLCCDIILAATTAKMGLPEVKLALVPGGGGTQRAVARLGLSRTADMVMTGAIHPAAAFERWGLVNEVVEPDALMARAMAKATEIASAPAEAIQGLKALTHFALSGDLQSGLDREGDLVRRLFRTDIAKARVAEFAARSAEPRGKKS